MSQLKSDTIATQSLMAEYCRVPGFDKEIPGARVDRLHNYRRLVFNIIEDTLQSAYPITHTLLTEEEWIQLVNDFFSRHNCTSTQLWRMPYELVEFVEKEEYHLKLCKPYLVELLYFEWLEIEIYQDEDKPHENFITEGDVMLDVPVINPDHKLLQLTYPVHKKNHKELEDNKGNYFVLIYRHRSNFTVNFLELSPFLALVFDHLLKAKTSIKNTLLTVGKNNGINEEEMLLQHGKIFAEQLQDHTLILGFAKK